MSDRGMKKWAPYASLIEQKGTIAKMKNHREKVKTPHLSQEMANEINDGLLRAKDQNVIIDYFFEGNKHQVAGLVTKMNFEQKWLIIDKLTLPFDLILSIRIL
jgi:hypothetical protein